VRGDNLCKYGESQKKKEEKKSRNVQNKQRPDVARTEVYRVSSQTSATGQKSSSKTCRSMVNTSLSSPQETDLTKVMTNKSYI
jgi:hypothetical protein